jgi:hypothetical protein
VGDGVFDGSGSVNEASEGLDDSDISFTPLFRLPLAATWEFKQSQFGQEWGSWLWGAGYIRKLNGGKL